MTQRQAPPGESWELTRSLSTFLKSPHIQGRSPRGVVGVHKELGLVGENPDWRSTPPGKCGPERYAVLVEIKMEACSKPFSCRGIKECVELAKRVLNGYPLCQTSCRLKKSVLFLET